MADYLQSLRLTAVEDTTISLNAVESPNSIQLEYRTGYGSSIETGWSNFSVGTEYNIGSSHWLELRGQNTQFSTDAYSYYTFTSTGQIDVSGELYSLIEYRAQIADQREYTDCFARLFRYCPVRNAKDLVLPYKSIYPYAYAYMFANCQNLISLPQIDGYGYGHYGYAYMFYETHTQGLTLVINRTDMQDQDEMFVQFVPEYGNEIGTVLITNQNVDIPTSVIPDFWNRQYVDDSQHDYLTLSDMVDASFTNIHCNSEDDLPQTFHFWARPETSLGLMPWRRVFPGRQLITNSENSDGITKIQLKGECLCAPDDYDSNRYDLVEQWSNSEVSMQTWSRIVSGKLTEFVDWRNPKSGGNVSLLATQCAYRTFFNNNEQLVDCSGLVLPEIVSGYSPNQMFYYMFSNCQSLTQAPELPATTLTVGCYSYMFNDCTSLTQAPELPATTLANYCYNSMFNGCTSLTQAPELPATTLVDLCYDHMFNGCTKIDHILWKSKTIPSSTYCRDWLNGVSAAGTFEYIDPDLDASSISRNASGVPSGWTIKYLRPKPSLVFSINGKAVTSLMIDGKAVTKLG